VSEKLPAVAEARMAAIRSSGTWGSALTAEEFAAIRSVGFEPVGQVFGAAVYGTGSTSGYSCPGAQGSSGDGLLPRPATQVSGQGGPGSFGPLVQTMDLARHTAVGRMITECAELGGHGVVGVRLSRESFPLGGPQFTALGTAVRAKGALYGQPVPFTCEVSGQDFAKLIMAGWVPAGLVLGFSIGSRHDDRRTARQARWGSGNTEVAGWTELVSQSRHDARRQLESDVGLLGAEGVVIATIEMRVRERECPETVGRRDHIVEATLIGTAVARFSRAEQRHNASALTIMSLDPKQRQAVIVQI
jgi:uncharacterized protein YbjQ (UPF0145 family)